MAPHYAIMRGEKRNTGAMNGIVRHISRTQQTPNADVEQQYRNYAVLGPSWDDVAGIHDAIEARTPSKFRRDAVRVIEYLVSASPQWFELNPHREREYFEAATAWFQSEFGAANVVSAVVHNDESSPHMHLLVVPRDESSGKPKLNAKGIFGNKGVLRRRQSEFSDAMAHFGVERGKADPERRHTKIRDWYHSHAQLDDREKVLKAREANAQSQVAVAEKILQETEERAERLSKRERAADQREKKLDDWERASSKWMSEYGPRVRAMKQREQRIVEACKKLQAWEARCDAWIQDNRPPELPDLVRHLQRLQKLPRLEAAQYLEKQDSDELYELFTPQDGLTSRGKAFMEQHEPAAEQLKRWDETMYSPIKEPSF